MPGPAHATLYVVWAEAQDWQTQGEQAHERVFVERLQVEHVHAACASKHMPHVHQRTRENTQLLHKRCFAWHHRAPSACHRLLNAQNPPS